MASDSVGYRIKEGLEEVAAAIDRHTEARERIARKSIANLTDEKLDRLERVVEMLLRLQEHE